MKVRAVPQKKIRVSIKTSELFNSLVENGFDFLKKSVADIKKSPKYSVIDFCSAVEIFLKARLVREHWSLILSKPELADVIKFKAGDFISVSMEEAIRRLDNICNEKISLETREAFKATRNHRNKLVHFFHPGYAKPSKNNIEQIVAEVCRAWFYIHQLLTNQWSDHFEAYQKAIGDLDLKMHKLRQFLKAKFDVLKPQIIPRLRQAVCLRTVVFVVLKPLALMKLMHRYTNQSVGFAVPKPGFCLWSALNARRKFGLKIWRRGNVRSAASM
jgi:hypothetical protein